MYVYKLLKEINYQIKDITICMKAFADGEPDAYLFKKSCPYFPPKATTSHGKLSQKA